MSKYTEWGEIVTIKECIRHPVTEASPHQAESLVTFFVFHRLKSPPVFFFKAGFLSMLLIKPYCQKYAKAPLTSRLQPHPGPTETLKAKSPPRTVYVSTTLEGPRKGRPGLVRDQSGSTVASGTHHSGVSSARIPYGWPGVRSGLPEEGGWVQLWHSHFGRPWVLIPPGLFSSLALQRNPLGRVQLSNRCVGGCWRGASPGGSKTTMGDKGEKYTSCHVSRALPALVTS